MRKKYRNVCEFWRKNQHDFPNVARLAMRILCIPASSASSERQFSLLNREAPPLRSSLKPSTLSNLVLLVTLSKYVDHLKKDEDHHKTEEEEDEESATSDFEG